MEAVTALHWLRPQWLWALLALPLLALWWRARSRRRHAWTGLVDAHLLPYLLEPRGTTRTWARMGAAALGYALAVVALAGPAWRQVEQPLWQSAMPLVIAVDLSSASLAADVPPSRLAIARAKVARVLAARDGGQVGLVAFAGDAFTVAPLTEDAANVALFLDALAPDVMPVDGQRADRAIEQSARLLTRAGFDRGRILLMTDHGDADADAAAERAARAGYRVDVIGVGGEAGAPFRGANGALLQARLDAASLRTLAASGDGDYRAVTLDDADLRALGVLDANAVDGASQSGERGRAWQDEGYWLLPPLMLLALFAFRRSGGAVAALALVLLLPWLPAQAADLWRRPDQAAHARLVDGTAAYRREDYARAAALYAGVDSADAHYNRGNALARAGRYPQAIAAYDAALKRQPGMADAIANRRAVEAAMKRKPPQGPKDGGAPSAGGQSPQPGQQGQADPQRSSPQGAPGEPTQPDRPAPAAADNRTTPEAKPADAQAQAEADRAQRQRIEQALARAGRAEPPDADADAPRAETAAQRERRLANEALLQRVPDDPGGLLRAKFRLEHERRLTQGRPTE
ncbi:VWA domain-containing protein [Cognatilysobacter tabacisoli]|uniref:VWA domain-containing protein n=1 Tax=Cognatilysobacter tabacisoli TaxID=2315424 RepID=UPI000E6B34A4|nr:VWA domain-containing protein [Lysobacter tabacisoli]